MSTLAMPLRVGNPAHTPADIYCSAWARMNADVRIAVREDRLHYLKSIAMSMDDDLASLLLLKKLKLAQKLAAAADLPDLVELNSYVAFRFGSGDRRFCRLLHPTVCRSGFDLSIASRLGAGVVGLRAGEVLLWPDEDGCPRELHIIAVKRSGVESAAP
jgi:regulator of nucleoside diphosphate kinase